MSTQRIKFIVERHWGSERAFVEADVSAEIADEQRFLEHLRRAVTTWVKRTKDGKMAWEWSSEDLNIGDLLHVMDSSGLKALLAAEGIRNLVINHPETCFTKCREWVYDSILVDSEAFKDEE